MFLGVGQFTLMMQNELEAMEGQEKMNKEKDPMKSLSVIEGVLHNFFRQKHPMVSMWHAQRQLCNCIKKRMKTLNNFVTIFFVKWKS